jgi:hypothetical protein
MGPTFLVRARCRSLRLDGDRVPFSPHLNCLIGIQGSVSPRSLRVCGTGSAFPSATRPRTSTTRKSCCLTSSRAEARSSSKPPTAMAPSPRSAASSDFGRRASPLTFCRGGMGSGPRPGRHRRERFEIAFLQPSFSLVYCIILRKRLFWFGPISCSPPPKLTPIFPYINDAPLGVTININGCSTFHLHL